MFERTLPFTLLLATLGCAAPSTSFSDRVVAAPGAHDGDFGDPTLATNGVRGGGDDVQSLDVYSIRHDSSLVLGWSGGRVIDGPGIDLVVFENPFRYGDGEVYMDPTVVEVSEDGEVWQSLPHDYLADDEVTYSPHPEDWQGFAGIEPVLLHEEDNPVDPFDPAVAGGDAFDLAELGVRGFRFVRLTSAAAHSNPDTGVPFPRAPVSDGPDIDGVYARYFEGEQ